MSMVFKLNSMGGEDSLPLFGGGGTELPSSFGAGHGAGGSGGDELCEELEPESTSMSVDCLAEEALVRARRGE